MQRLKPFVFSFARRALGPAGPVLQEILQPEEVETVEPPAMLQGSVDRIVSADARSTRQEQVERITSRTMCHSPVIRLTYENVVAAPDGFATWRDGVRFNEALLADALWAKMSHVNSLRYPITGVNRYYFGHWLMDGLSTCLIDTDASGALMLPDPNSGVAGSNRFDRFMNVISGRVGSRGAGLGKTDGPSHADDYRRIFGFEPVQSALVHADRLILYRDSGQGSHKRARYAKMRATVRDHFDASTPSEGVYIRRGTTGLVRQIENEDAICETLAAHGWTILDIADVTVEELFYHVHGTRIVVGLDGSHINHAILMLPDNGALMVLAPPDRFTSTHMDHARGCDLGTGYVVLEGQDGQYRTSADAILKTAEMTLNAVDKRLSVPRPAVRANAAPLCAQQERRQSRGLDVDVEVGRDPIATSGTHSRA